MSVPGGYLIESINRQTKEVTDSLNGQKEKERKRKLQLGGKERMIRDICLH